MKRTALKRGKPIERRSRLARRTVLRKIGRRTAGLIQQRSAFRRDIMLRDQRCQLAAIAGSECSGRLEVSHVQPQGTYPELRFLADNVLLACHHHHRNWWHRNSRRGKAWFARTYPSRWATIELRIKHGSDPAVRG
jgi:hypothetical protein